MLAHPWIIQHTCRPFSPCLQSVWRNDQPPPPSSIFAISTISTIMLVSHFRSRLWCVEKYLSSRFRFLFFSFRSSQLDRFIRILRYVCALYFLLLPIFLGFALNRFVGSNLLEVFIFFFFIYSLFSFLQEWWNLSIDNLLNDEKEN